jgi:Flp pilus assembly protein TadD
MPICGGTAVSSNVAGRGAKARRCKDWAAAIDIVDREIARAPNDMDIRACRARVLTWSGKLVEAESEYRHVLTFVSNDPDIWLGLASVYSREGQTKDALQALDRAVYLDPKRADIWVAHAGALRAIGFQEEAKLEFNRALDLDPTNVEARAGLAVLRGELRHELQIGANTSVVRHK